MRAIVAVVAFCAGTAHAQVCPKLEFAEMDAMAREELLAQRCEYRDDMLKASAVPSYQLAAAANRCAIELDRMDRIIARKYKLTAKGDDLFIAVGRLCYEAKQKGK